MNESSLIIRPVTMEDASLLFEWRNEEETRRQSRTREVVTLEGHIRWLEDLLKSPTRILCIAECDGQAIGTVRADAREDGYTEISYTIAPNARGKGLSKPMVLRFVEQYIGGKQLAAVIKKGHGPSESVAKALSLKPFSEIASEDPDDPRPMAEWR